MNEDAFQQLTEQIVAQVRRVFVGQDAVIEEVLLGILAGGHVLLEGVPGMGKTLLMRSLAHVMGCATSRIQFTPDLMPADVTGGNVYDQRTGQFDFVAGPVFTSLLLADEINRATAKTQSALLEAMQERTVTVDGQTRPLPAPFFVLATQNPVESQGTHPLPEAQLDRFLLKVQIDYPTRDDEKALLRNVAGGFDAAELARAELVQVCTAEEVLAMQTFARSVTIDESLLEYIVDIVRGTREHRSVMLGASPRASVALVNLARVQAALSGRNFVTPDDVKRLITPALRHRIMLHPDAEFQGLSTRQCLAQIVDAVRVPGMEAAESV